MAFDDLPDRLFRHLFSVVAPNRPPGIDVLQTSFISEPPPDRISKINIGCRVINRLAFGSSHLESGGPLSSGRTSEARQVWRKMINSCSRGQTAMSNRLRNTVPGPPWVQCHPDTRGGDTEEQLRNVRTSLPDACRLIKRAITSRSLTGTACKVGDILLRTRWRRVCFPPCR